MDECRKELKAGNIDAKANAVSKLCYVCHLVFYTNFRTSDAPALMHAHTSPRSESSHGLALAHGPPLTYHVIESRLR